VPWNTHGRLSYIHFFIRPFIHCFTYSTVYLTTGPQPLQKRVLRRVRSSASSFNVQSLLVLLKSSSSCLPLLPCLSVTSIVPSVFPSITCFIRQLLCKIQSTQFAFLAFILRRIFLPSLIVCNISFFFLHYRSTWSPSFSITTFQNFAGISDLLSEVFQVPAPYTAAPNVPLYYFFLKFKSSEKNIILFEYCFCLGNPGFIFVCASCIVFSVLPNQVK